MLLQHAGGSQGDKAGGCWGCRAGVLVLATGTHFSRQTNHSPGGGTIFLGAHESILVSFKTIRKNGLLG